MEDELKLDGGGMRSNTGKTRFSLIPAAWTRGLAEVMTAGAKKYAPRNWERGMDPDFMLDSMFRHIDAFRLGERYDQETRCHHLFHAAWNVLALATYDIRAQVPDAWFQPLDFPTQTDERPTSDK